jgi:hypothetical protein
MKLLVALDFGRPSLDRWQLASDKNMTGTTFSAVAYAQSRRVSIQIGAHSIIALN